MSRACHSFRSIDSVSVGLGGSKPRDNAPCYFAEGVLPQVFNLRGSRASMMRPQPLIFPSTPLVSPSARGPPDGCRMKRLIAPCKLRLVVAGQAGGGAAPGGPPSTPNVGGPFPAALDSAELKGPRTTFQDPKRNLRFQTGFGPKTMPDQAQNTWHGAHRPAHKDSERLWPDFGVFR